MSDVWDNIPIDDEPAPSEPKEPNDDDKLDDDEYDYMISPSKRKKFNSRANKTKRKSSSSAAAAATAKRQATDHINLLSDEDSDLQLLHITSRDDDNEIDTGDVVAGPSRPTTNNNNNNKNIPSSPLDAAKIDPQSRAIHNKAQDAIRYLEQLVQDDSDDDNEDSVEASPVQLRGRVGQLGPQQQRQQLPVEEEQQLQDPGKKITIKMQTRNHSKDYLIGVNEKLEKLFMAFTADAVAKNWVEKAEDVKCFKFDSELLNSQHRICDTDIEDKDAIDVHLK